MHKRKGILLSTYMCPKCKHWHLGNSPDSRVQRVNTLFDEIAKRDAERVSVIFA